MSQTTFIGEETKSALKNFPFPTPPVHIELIHSILKIKKAASIANHTAKNLDKKTASQIQTACDLLLSNKYVDQFITNSIQGGAGTSINANVNEVIANFILNKMKNSIHPNDHVNMSQSTNDVNPSALKITCLQLLSNLYESSDILINSFEKQAKLNKKVVKLARTHLQDAIPVSFGNIFKAYADIVRRNINRIKDCESYLYELSLGGTAIGNSINASEEYIKYIYLELRKISGLKIKKAENLMAQTSSQSDFTHLSSMLMILFADLSKIATDLKILSSGPNAGIGEITLKELQKGSSIMPGKINPVIPESINQCYYYISGKNLTIIQGSEAANLELGVMFPVIADSIISSLKLATSAITNFATNCIDTLVVNRKIIQTNLENSTAYATLLTPLLGYDRTSDIVKKANKKNQSIHEIILSENILTKKELDEIIDNSVCG